MTLPLFFLVTAGAALVFALGSLWNSLRTAFGDRVRIDARDIRDLPEHAALQEEKKALLRGIKDLEYEREVGKIGSADFDRLNRAYRARVKQVMVELDHDVVPLMSEAERLLAAHTGGGASPKRPRKAKTAQPKAASVSDVSPPVSRESGSREASIGRAPSSSKPSTSNPTGSESKETESTGTESAEELPKSQAKTAAQSEEEPSLDELVARIKRGELTEAPEPPAAWPESARKFFRDTLSRALDEHEAEGKGSPAASTSSSEPAS